MILARRRNLQLCLQQLKFSNNSPFPNPQNQLSGDVSEYEKLCVIGQGNYGVVHKVINRKTSAIYALKTIQESNSTMSGMSHEVEILKSTDSPSLVKCYSIFEPRAGEKAILMEYMEAGTLDSVARSIGPLPETLTARIAKQVLDGLNYLRESNIVHLDIKPSNLLVNEEMEVKIGDFGVSRIIGKDSLVDSCEVGTYAYMSPERLDPEKFGRGDTDVYAGDVWSLGVSLWELYVGHFPFFEAGKKPSWMEIVLVVCHGEFPRFPSQASDEFVRFLMCCLEREPSKRWTASQLLKHPFISNSN